MTELTTQIASSAKKNEGEAQKLKMINSIGAIVTKIYDLLAALAQHLANKEKEQKVKQATFQAELLWPGRMQDIQVSPQKHPKITAHYLPARRQIRLTWVEDQTHYYVPETNVKGFQPE